VPLGWSFAGFLHELDVAQLSERAVEHGPLPTRDPPPSLSWVNTRPGVASVSSRPSLDRRNHGPEARALLAFPWETTPIGPVDSWPEQLRVLVQVMLSSEFPMMIVWGGEYTQLYNDAFRPILGTGKHPDALGRGAHETWAEIWDEIGPLFASVFAGEAVWNADHRLLINRNGYDEEAFFTYSYSPIHDDSDVVAGLLVVATETTAQVVDRRRLSCIGDLASALVGATSIESVADVTIDALRDCVPATAIAIDVVVADTVARIASLPGHRGETTDRALILNVATSPLPIVLDEGWEAGRPASRVAFAIDHPKLRTVVTVATNRCRPFDEEYQQFIELVRSAMSASMTAALIRADEIGALRIISDTLQDAMLELASDLPTVAARYMPKASNLTVGGDWYDVLDLGGGRRGLIVGDCVGHGLEAATAMGALRNVSRALLADGHGPAEVIASLDRFATTMPAAACATVVCAVVDLPELVITYSNAGHPPPLLVHDEQVVWLDQALATPLAVNDAMRREARLDVRPDDLLVLYTDGLVERRNESLDEGLLRLAMVAVACRDEPVEDVANRLIEEMVGTTARDDVALVVKRIH
jgi:serine phosphatase RsbU (regulator of sigma subunit)